MMNKKDYVSPELTARELSFLDVLLASSLPDAEDDPFGETNPWSRG